MANLPETPDYPAGIYQLETSDPVLGGPGGISNRQAEQLGNRTAWLKAKVDSFIEGTVAVLKATKLATARTLSVSGAASGSASFDGSANANIVLTLADSGAAAGTYPKVTVNAKGLVTAGAALVTADIPALDWSKIVSGKPTTLSGYGITDGAPLANPAFTGNPSSPTQPQFDNSSNLATTAFVQRALGNFKGEAVYNADTALTADAFGRVVILAGSANGNRTFTLPSASLGVPGARILLWNNSAYTLTVVPAAGNALDTGTSLPTSIVLGAGSSLDVLCLPNSLYRVVGGTANLRASSEFAASLGFNGYHRLPSGVIEQWGSASALATSEIRTVTLPVAYPTGVRCVVLTGDGGNSQVRVAALGTTSFQIQNLGTALQNCYWRAIGH